MDERLAELLRKLYGLANYDNLRTAGEVASMTPTPLGDVASGMLAVDDLRKGDYLGAAGNAVGLLPFVPAVGGITKHWGSNAFKDFFGGSKVTTQGGDPLVVFHGTADDVSKFSKESIGKRERGWYGDGFYFTPNQTMASDYASTSRKSNNANSPNVIPAYVSLKNPFEMYSSRNELNLLSERQKRYIKSEYDGVIVRDSETGEILEVVAFEPNQIKSAIGNKGTYDAKSDEITK